MTNEKMAEEYSKSACAWIEDREPLDERDVQQAFLAGLKAGRPKWHKVADGDLPKNSDNERLYWVYWGENDYSVAQFNNSRWWSLDSGWYDAEDVIAWCGIPQYEEE